METESTSRPLTGEDYKAIWKRRKWWFLGTTALVTGVTCLVVALLPSFYRSEALILIEQPAAQQEYVKPIVAADSDQIISGLIQQVMSRTVLGRLDLLKKSGAIAEKDLEDFRQAVTITPLRDSNDPRRPAGKPYGLKVSFLGSSPEQAQRVTNELAALVVDEAGRMTLEQAEKTTNVLRAQLELAVAKVRGTGEALANFRKQYAGQLPIDEQLTIQTLSNLQTESQVNTQALTRTRQNIADVETAMQSPAAGQSETSEASSTAQDPGLSRLVTDLQTLKDKLADLQSRYKPGHPDVIKTRDQIKLLEAEVATEKAERAASKTSKPGVTPTHATPATVARARQSQAELAAHTAERSQLERQMAHYQANLLAIPGRQQQYSELERDYDAAKKDYETVRDQVSDAEHSTDVYQRQKVVRYRIQDYASLPATAELPVRWKINLGGLGGALALGLVLAGIMEFRDTSAKSEPDVDFYFGLKCLALIPELPTPVKAKRGRGKRYAWMLASGLLVLVLAGLNLYMYFGRLWSPWAK